MDARMQQRVISELAAAVSRLERLACRLKQTSVRMAAGEGTLRIRRRVSGVSGVPRPRAGPRAGVASSCSKVPFRGEVARADATGRLRRMGR